MTNLGISDNPEGLNEVNHEVLNEVNSEGISEANNSPH